MKNTFRRIVAFVAVLALILSETVCFLQPVEAQAATKKFTLTVANKKLIVKDGKRQIKTYTVNAGSTFRFVNKSKRISHITYRSSSKKVLTVTKKGVVSIKKDAGGKLAKVRISAKYKKKRVKVNLKISVKEKSTAVPTATPDAVSSATQSTEAPVETPQVTTKPTNEPTEVPQASAEPTKPKSKGKTLVVYFSRAGENYNVGIVDKGNTAIVAEKIAEKTGADVFEILAEDPYPTGYEDCKNRATNERNDGARPKYIGDVEDWSSYSLVFLGYPIWWGDMPMIVYSFLEDHDWAQKTVIPFNTHEGSGQSGTQAIIEGKCRGADVRQGIAIRGSTAQGAKETEITELSAWLEDLKLNER